jgi:MFS transporter, FSR family, fosmidomycin resistance protein
MTANLTSSVIQPCSGYVSDRARFKWLLPASTALVFMGFALIGFAPSYAVLLVFVVASGIAFSFYHPECLKIVHHVSGVRKATGMGYFQVGGNVGMALGPLFMTYAVQVAGMHGTALALVFGLPVAGLLAFSQKRLTLSIEKEERGAQDQAGSRPAALIKGAWTAMTLLIAAMTLRSITHMGLITFVPFYYISVLNGDALTAGKLVFAFLLGGAIGTVFGAIIADRVGHKRFFCLSLVFSVPFLLSLFYAEGVWLFVLIFMVGAVLVSSFSVTIVMGQALLPHRLGVASGLMLGFVIGVGGIGAGLLGIVADTWGILWVMRLIALMPAAALVPALAMRGASGPPDPTS